MSVIRRGKKKGLLTPTTFSLLHATDFADRFERRILPPLRAGYLVVSDRYAYTASVRDATRATGGAASDFSFASSLIDGYHTGHMYCPVCGRAMNGPSPSSVPYPMFICPHDGVVYDRRREVWHGLPDVEDKLCCPVCGGTMEKEPKERPHRIFFCYQCGTTFDRERTTWYGLAYYLPPL